MTEHTAVFLRDVAKRRSDRMRVVDGMSEDWRALVHEYGYSVIHQMRNCGVTQANHARHIIETVLNELSPTRHGFSNQGQSTTTKIVMVPLDPSSAMIEASMATVSGHDVSVTKYEKHRRRIRAALDVGQIRS